jgi:hypothetical protein
MVLHYPQRHQDGFSQRGQGAVEKNQPIWLFSHNACKCPYSAKVFASISTGTLQIEVDENRIVLCLLTGFQVQTPQSHNPFLSFDQIVDHRDC